MKQITIIGVSITGNRGAEAMLATTIGRIRDRHPEALFNVFSIYPDEDSKLIDDDRIRIFSSTPFYLLFILFPLSIIFSITRFLGMDFLERFFPKAVSSIANSSIFIDLSGVSFIDDRLKFLPYNILTILPALILGIPVVKGAQAMGPFNKFLNRLSAGLLLKKCDQVFARGRFTKHYLSGLKLNNVANTTDIAFLHEFRDTLGKENSKYAMEIIKKISRFKSNGQLVVGICPSSVVYTKADDSYIRLFVNIIDHILTSGHAVLLFPNATRENHMRKLHNNDLPVIQKIVDAFQSRNKHKIDNVVFVYRNINTDSIKKLITSVDLAVISRFHAMVNCLNLGIPPLVIGWSEKYLEIMERFNMEEWVFDYTAENKDEIVRKMDLLVSHRRELSARIRKRCPEIKKLAAIQTNYINSFLSQDDENQ